MSATTHPKQCRLLGAEVKGKGQVVSVTLDNCEPFAVVRRPSGSISAYYLGYIKQLGLRLSKRQQPYREFYDELCGTDMYVLASDPKSIELAIPAHRRQLFRRARA